MKTLKHPALSSVSLAMAGCWKCLVAVALAGVASAASSLEEPKAAAPATRYDEMILRMGDDSFQVRERASRELWAEGEKALSALRKATHDKNPEIAFRARDLVRKVELFLTPDTDQAVVGLVESYVTGGTDMKIEMMGRLKEKRAWRQMLKLFASESNGALRAKLRRVVEGVAVVAAREQLAAGDADGARGFLEMGPADAAGLLALADFHRTQGSWDDEWRKSLDLTGPRRHMWQLALLRAKCDVTAALPAAEKAEEGGVAAVLAALDGNPLPWLAVNGARVSPDSDLGETYADLAVRRWKGQELRAGDLAPFIRSLGARSRSVRFAAMAGLAALGEGALAEESLVAVDKIDAAAHFEAMERGPDALRALGIDPAEPNYEKWIDQRFHELADDDVEDQVEPHDPAGELIAFAGFLERKGMHDLAWDLFSEPLAKLSEEDPPLFEELLGGLFRPGTSTGAPMLGEKTGARWAGDDAERWESLAISAVGDEETALDWWGWLEKTLPEQDALERFHGLRALFRLGTDPGRLRGKYLELAWKSVDEAAVEKRPAMLLRMSVYATYNDDARTYIEAYDRMDEAQRGKLQWDDLVQFLTSAGRWDEVGDLLTRKIRSFEESDQAASADMHAFAAAALRRAGREDDAAVHDAAAAQLALGDAGAAYMVAIRYAYCMDSERAASWWQRAAVWCDPRSQLLVHCLRMHAEQLLESENWLDAAAVGELVTVLIRVNEEYGMPFSELTRARLQADTARAISRLATDREGSVALLARCHSRFRTDGSLADFFFPSLRKAGLRAEHDRWFEESWSAMNEAVSAYPECDNSRNTAAWLASRSLLRLEEARALLEGALELRPLQPAYLDTMAEIHFALHRREDAIRWSDLALAHAPGDILLRKQHERFRNGPFPD